jgi:cell wall-associated NlpC family hydrolase
VKLTEFCEKSIGVPFVEHGRDSNGWDCWGLVCCAYKEIYGIDLPDFHEKYVSTTHINIVKKAVTDGIEYVLLNGWKLVDDQQEGDIVVFFMKGHSIHVGLAIDAYKVIHVEDGIETCLQKTTDFRTEGIYRHGC